MVAKFDRREAVKMLGAGLVTTTTGCVGSIGGGNELRKQLSTVEENTKQFASPRDALEAGFKPMGPYVPGMGWHFNSRKRTKQLVEDGLTVEKPNLLTYVRADSGLQLGAVEWGIPTKAAPDTPDLFADENQDATEKWHQHESATHVFAVPDGKRTTPGNVALNQWLTNEHWAEFRPPDRNLEPGDTASLHWGVAESQTGRPERASRRPGDHASRPHDAPRLGSHGKPRRRLRAREPEVR